LFNYDSNSLNIRPLLLYRNQYTKGLVKLSFY